MDNEDAITVNWRHGKIRLLFVLAPVVPCLSARHRGSQIQYMHIYVAHLPSFVNNTQIIVNADHEQAQDGYTNIVFFFSKI